MGNHCHLLPFSPVATQLKMSKAHLEIRQAKTSLGTHQDYEKQVPESRHCNMAYYCFSEYAFSFTRQSSLSFLPLPGFRMGFSGQTLTEIQQPNTWQCFKTETPNLCQEITTTLLPAERLKNRGQFYFIFQELQPLTSVTLK